MATKNLNEMNVTELRTEAKKLSIDTKGLKKPELIKAIESANTEKEAFENAQNATPENSENENAQNASDVELSSIEKLAENAKKFSDETKKLLATAVKNDKAIDTNIPSLLEATTSAWVGLQKSLRGLGESPTKYIKVTIEGKEVEVYTPEFSKWRDKRDRLENVRKQISSALDFDSDVINGMTSSATLKTLKQWFGFLTSEKDEKINLVFDSLTNINVELFDKNTKKAWDTVGKLILMILQKKKFDESVAKKDEIWTPAHFYLSEKNGKQTLELKVWADDPESVDYRDRYTKFTKGQGKTVNVPNKAQNIAKEYIKSRKKALGLKTNERLPDEVMLEVSAKATVEALQNSIELFETAPKSLITKLEETLKALKAL